MPNLTTHDNSPTTERMRRPVGGRFAQTTHHKPRNTRRDRTNAAAILAALDSREG